MLVTARAVARGSVLDLVISRAISGKSLGLAATRRFARVMIFSLAAGAVSSGFSVRRKKTCARDKIVGSSAVGCSVIRTKWQKSLGSSSVFKNAF